MVPSSPRAFAPFIKPVMVELTVFWTISEGVERASINLIKICDTWRSRRRGGSDRRAKEKGVRGRLKPIKYIAITCTPHYTRHYNALRYITLHSTFIYTVYNYKTYLPYHPQRAYVWRGCRGAPTLPRAACRSSPHHHFSPPVSV